MPMIALLIKMSSVKAWGVRHHRTCSRPSGTGRVLAVTSGKSGLLNHPPEVSAAGPGMGAGRELKSQKQKGRELQGCDLSSAAAGPAAPL